VVDRAGSVTVTPEPAGLRLGAVEATPGWTWSVSEQGTAHLALLFTDGSSSLLFTARTGADGTVTRLGGDGGFAPRCDRHRSRGRRRVR
jgi:hypothetical protein